mmetsp:Transcript_24/g.92  ORF Transcript_24/g.92 Transcript_24/m.92 type:complete len:324 (+) Transcript_24:460-1431(+)
MVMHAIGRGCCAASEPAAFHARLAAVASSTAGMQASRTRKSRSAPLKEAAAGSRATAPRSTSSARGLARVSVRRMASRPVSVGSGTYSTLSRRPGRSNAGSMTSYRLVAATTNTPSRPSTPSISVRSWFTTLSELWLLSDERREASASTSSKNRMQGRAARARLNRVRTARSDSPTYLSSSSGPLMEMKFAADSQATALANSVFPHPGGPYSSTPLAALRPISAKVSGSSIGRLMAMCSCLRTSSRDPTSAKVTLGVGLNPSRRTLGCTLATAASKSDMDTARPIISSSVSLRRCWMGTWSASGNTSRKVRLMAIAAAACLSA